MMPLPDALSTLITGLRITDEGSIWVHEQRYLQASQQDREKLPANLAMCVYQLAYTRACSNPTSPPVSTPPPEIDYTAIIARANTTQSKTETDWAVIEKLPNGTVLAGRHGKTRHFPPGQYVYANDDYSTPASSKLVTFSPAGSHTAQPGFYYCFSDGFQEANDRSPLVRLYWHVRQNQVGLFVQTLTSALNRYRIPFQFKITTHSGHFDRADNAVLYLADRWFAIAAMALEAVMPQISSCLNAQIPLFTKAMAPGVGFAQDPGHGESFGSSRCKLVAAAILAGLNAQGQIDLAQFNSHFQAGIAKAGLRADALYLNPGSPDCYQFATQITELAMNSPSHNCFTQPNQDMSA